jgi:hypothetical protein
MLIPPIKETSLFLLPLVNLVMNTTQGSLGSLNWIDTVSHVMCLFSSLSKETMQISQDVALDFQSPEREDPVPGTAQS